MTDLNEFENELGKLKPMPLSDGLKQRVSLELFKSAEASPLLPARKLNTLSPILALAASVMLALTIYNLLMVPKETRHDTVYSQNTYERTWAEPLHVGLNSSRKGLKQVMHQKKWHDPNRNVDFEMFVPQEEIVQLSGVQLRDEKNKMSWSKSTFSLMAKSQQWSSYSDGEFHINVRSVKGQPHLTLSLGGEEGDVLYCGAMSKRQKLKAAIPNHLRPVIQILTSRDGIIEEPEKRIKVMMGQLKAGAKIRMYITDPEEIEKLKKD